MAGGNAHPHIAHLAGGTAFISLFALLRLPVCLQYGRMGGRDQTVLAGGSRLLLCDNFGGWGEPLWRAGPSLLGAGPSLMEGGTACLLCESYMKILALLRFNARLMYDDAPPAERQQCSHAIHPQSQQVMLGHE